MIARVDLAISSFEITDTGRLSVTVASLPLGSSSTFHRVRWGISGQPQGFNHAGERIGRSAEGLPWRWGQLSAADKVSIAVKDDAAEMLDQLVALHPVLGRLTEHYGIVVAEAADA